MLFPPISYITAEKMKKMIQRTGAAYKETVRCFKRGNPGPGCRMPSPTGCSAVSRNGRKPMKQILTAYEKSAVKANIWNTAMPPVYRVISMAGVLFILYFGQKNVLGTGWQCMEYRRVSRPFWPVL